MAAHSEDFVILACVCLTQYHSVADGRTDGRTNERTPRRWLRRAQHSSVARKSEQCRRLCREITMCNCAAGTGERTFSRKDIFPLTQQRIFPAAVNFEINSWSYRRRTCLSAARGIR